MDEKIERKPYAKPEIQQEIDLETKAGSGIEPGVLDPFSSNEDE